MAIRISDVERDALKQAAEAAKTVLPKLMEERENLDRRIGVMQAVIAAHDSQGKREKPTNGPEGEQPRKRARKGQIAEEVADVLSGKEMELRQIRDAVQQQYGTRYARNTVLTVLQREQNRFNQGADKKWRVNPLMIVPKAS